MEASSSPTGRVWNPEVLVKRGGVGFSTWEYKAQQGHTIGRLLGSEFSGGWDGGHLRCSWNRKEIYNVPVGDKHK